MPPAAAVMPPGATEMTPASTEIFTENAIAKKGLVALAVSVAGLTFAGELWPQATPYLQTPYAVGLMGATHQMAMNTFVHYSFLKMNLGFSFLFFGRTIFCAIFGVALACLSKEPVAPQSRGVQVKVLLRAVLGTVSVVCLFGALTCAPAPFVIVMYSARSLWATLGMWLLLGEVMEWRKLGSMGVGFSAVVLVILSTATKETKLSSRLEPSSGLFLAGISSVMAAVNGLTIRSMGGEVHHLALVCGLAAVGLVVCFPLFHIYPQHFADLSLKPTPQMGAFCLVGCFSFLMQLCTNKAYLLERTGPVMLFMNAAALVLQFTVDVLMGYRYGPLAWAGIFVLLLYLMLSTDVKGSPIVSFRFSTSLERSDSSSFPATSTNSNEG